MIGITKSPRDSYRGEASEDGEAVRSRDSPQVQNSDLCGDSHRRYRENIMEIWWYPDYSRPWQS